jgi:hypothetical protein
MMASVACCVDYMLTYRYYLLHPRGHTIQRHYLQDVMLMDTSTADALDLVPLKIRVTKQTKAEKDILDATITRPSTSASSGSRKQPPTLFDGRLLKHRTLGGCAVAV